MIREVRPADGDPGDIFTTHILGDALSGTTRASFGGGIDVLSLSVIGDGDVAVKIRIDMGATPGPRDVFVEVPPDVLSAGFTVL